MTEIQSRRGVYFDLSKSPYEFKTPYGDLFKFRSPKKLEIYTRDISKELNRFYKYVHRNRLNKYISAACCEEIERGIYRALYYKIEG